MNCKSIILIFFLFFFLKAHSQNTSAYLGHSPVDAIFLCKDSTYFVDTLPLLIGPKIQLPGCFTIEPFTPFWFRFKCYRSGDFSFNLTKLNTKVAYQNWVVYDITGRPPEDVYTNPLIIAFNWSANSRNNKYTGAAPFGRGSFICSYTDSSNAYNSMLDLVAGHEYLLLVSAHSPFHPDFILKMGAYGGTATVIDSREPAIIKAWTDCEGEKLFLVSNKLMHCNSLAADGSDFELSAEGVAVSAARAYNCKESLLDTLEIDFDKALLPGDYTLFTKKGNDGNTLLDMCGTELPEDMLIGFKVESVKYSTIEQVVVPDCTVQQIEIKLNRLVLCNTIAKDGSDFEILGPSAVKVVGAMVPSAGNYTASVLLTFSNRVEKGGRYTLKVVNGNDNNTILGECNLPIPAGQSADFYVNDILTAEFDIERKNGCKVDTLDFRYSTGNAELAIAWSIENTQVGIGSILTQYFKTPGDKKIELKVSNGLCSARKDSVFTVDEKLHAEFEYPADICSDDWITFKDKSSGNIRAWNWNFDNGYTSQSGLPESQKFPGIRNGRSQYVIQLIVSDGQCRDTIKHKIQVRSGCVIVIPSAFTPNNDGRNDKLYPLNTHKASNIDFVVYNRYGQRIFRSTRPESKWDGTFNGLKQPSGTYVWTLSYIEKETGKKIAIQGYTVLIR